MREKKGNKTRKPKGEPELPQEYVPPPLPLPGDDFAMWDTGENNHCHSHRQNCHGHSSTPNPTCIMQPVREVVKPDNQLQLSEAELNDEVAKMLTANNPTAPKNVARYNVKERAYKVRHTARTCNYNQAHKSPKSSIYIPSHSIRLQAKFEAPCMP
eukprot:scaffold27799_cov21-Tisochrysis_lutea.AAC.1